MSIINHAKSIEDVFLNHDCRLENEHREFYVLSIIDRSKYPRLWIDNGLESEESFVSESIDHLLLRSNPLLEKDWIVRFEDETITGIIEQYNNWKQSC